MEIKQIEITPDMASSFLEKNTSNRSLSKETVKAYSSDMMNGNWSTTHQGIAFYDDGTLADGQHRLHAIVNSGVTVTMMVTTGIPRKDCLNIDNHRIRKTHDAFKIAGQDDWISDQSVVSMARMSLSIFKKKDKASNIEILEFIESNKPHFLFVKTITAQHRKGISAPLLAALVAAHKSGIAESILSELVSILYSGISSEPYHVTAIKLRDVLRDTKQSGSTARKEIFLKSQRAIQAFSIKQPISKLYTPETPIYEL